MKTLRSLLAATLLPLAVGACGDQVTDPGILGAITCSIQWPNNGATYARGQAIHFQGSVRHRDHGVQTGWGYRWHLGSTSIGSGQRFEWTGAPAGTHTIELRTSRPGWGSIGETACTTKVKITVK